MGWYTPFGKILIPAQLLPATGTATHLEIKFIAARINIKEQRIVRSTSSTIIIDLSTPFNGAALEAAVPGNGTLILVLQTRTYNGQEATGNRRFMAADIIGIIPSRPLKKKINSIPSLHKLPYNTPHTCLPLRSMDRENKSGIRLITPLATEWQLEWIPLFRRTNNHTGKPSRQPPVSSTINCIIFVGNKHALYNKNQGIGIINEDICT